MDAELQQVIERIHASDFMTVMAVTGGGSQSIAWILSVPNASQTLLEAVVPYASAALTQYIGLTPKQYASPATCRRMAHSAFLRAMALSTAEAPLQGRDPMSLPPVVGIACTATIATGRPKRGDHRCYVAAWRKEGWRMYGLTLRKDLGRTREGEELVVSRLVLKALAEACGVPFSCGLALAEGEVVEVSSREVDAAGGGPLFSNYVEDDDEDPLKKLLEGRTESVLYRAGAGSARGVAGAPFVGAVLPGSFNPLHDGHTELAAVARRLLGCEVAFEISVANADKPTIAEEAVRRRLAQFGGRHNVLVTRAPLFLDKARLFPGCTFVIGIDTYARLVDPKYYANNADLLADALALMRSLKIRFLVAGRLDRATGEFESLAPESLPLGYEVMFEAVPEALFRTDISSTELRARGVSV